MRVFSVPTPQTMDRYRTGALLHEANDATRSSGHGAIRDDRAHIVEMLRPAAFEYDMADDEYTRGETSRRGRARAADAPTRCCAACSLLPRGTAVFDSRR